MLLVVPNPENPVHKMVEFCETKLMSKMNNQTSCAHPIKPAMGYCCETDDNRTFEIEVDKFKSLRDSKLETVAHEMVHVKQYARRELRLTSMFGWAKL